MSHERWQQVKAIFQSALDLAPERRAEFLTDACAGHDSLRREVESLIFSHEQPGHFIDAPAFQAAAEMLADGQEFKPGETLSHYEIRSVLGEGGMGKVYLAWDTKLKRKVALKVLFATSRGDEEARRRLLREAQAAAALDHPNICAIYEVDDVGDPCYIAMQYLEGETLEARMGKGRLSLDEAPNIASQIADALCEAHARGIIHRDIKPANVMLNSRGQVKVLDFGLAKTARAASAGPNGAGTKRSLTTPGTILGTVPYMSPEQLRGETVDARSDIFSFGVVIYEMLSGHTAFGRGTDAETIGAILHEPPKLSSIDPRMPKALADVVSKCLAKDVEWRYQTVQQVAHDLNAARNGERAAMQRLASRTLKAGIARGHKRIALLITASVVIAVALFGYYSYFVKGGKALDSIAVLPFVNVANDASAEYLSDGISDGIINSLSELPNLNRVIPFSSVLSYKGKQIDPQAVGHELNVGAVLTGRLTLRGDDVLVSTELVDAKDNKRLWGGQYSYKLADVFKLKGEIARDISEKLRLKLTGEQKEQLTKPGTENAEAYQLYLQGLYYWRKNTDEATLKSGEYFRQAIEKDPDFALAHVGLARYYIVMAGFGNMRSNEAWPQAEAAVVKALAIDEKLSDAHEALGLVKMWYDWDWPGAERELKRALELNPQGDRGYMNRLLEATGRIDEAIADASVDWNQPPGTRVPREARLAKLLSLAGRYDEAIEQWRKFLEKDPNRRSNVHLGIGEIYVRQGRYEEALAEMLEARPRVRQPRELARIGYVYAAAGERDEAIKILEEVKALTGERHNLRTHIAAIYAALDDKDEALAWLKKACDEHEQGVIELKVDHRFDTLRSDPIYMDLLRRVKLAP